MNEESNLDFQILDHPCDCVMRAKPAHRSAFAVVGECQMGSP